ncbi:uncharacterized protein LAJ45_01192 [Morchella importuna]|uniref:Hydrophobin n=1 Tax=Morchella conica CCBAS932 TaxID=1392247 RepID=A0A3N4KVN0_9PEZI|nr:uncharacterized protein LAJ45_01192 [Morchella importuna]KAH8154663.1 hypothetical protein LAJ45_01192 [Morchella importuna]RPB12411.1 hypothetical protein P167DRAFT_545640 [Morchella conica CCBAS932]
MQFRLFALLATVALTLASPLHIRQDNNDNNDNNQISGNDGSGDQIVGNNGQNAGNAASNSGKVNGDLTIQQATTTCGNAQLNCCNKVEKKGDTTSAGLLGSVFGSGDLGVQCSPINVAALAVQVPVNKACDAKAACCQGDNTQNGVVNVGCIALASLL